ncbi:MAG: sulfatase-like hydrolase/transferase, partial [Planctomycetota bacterium]
DALTIEALAHVTDAVDEHEPFFLYLSHYAVHSPHQSDPRFASNYSNSGKPERVQNFATLVEGMDKSLGDVLDRLEQLGVAEETILFFLGDNGSDAPLGHEHAVACAAPLRGRKGSHYEGGVRVPFIAAWGKHDVENSKEQSVRIPPGEVQQQMANVCDLLPTICELVGVDLPENHAVDGRSLSRLLTGIADPDHSQQFLMHFPHRHRSSYYSTLRDGDWKVAYQYLKPEDAGGKRYQLFNLASDPFEQNDVADDQPGKLREMMLKLDEQLIAHEAQYPVKDALIKPLIP